jgi:hypothetical protein
MDIVAVDLEELADEIARAFTFDAIGPAEVTKAGHLLETLVERGARVLKSAFVPELFAHSEASVFAAATDERFWTNTAFLMYVQVSGQPGPFYRRALLARNVTSVDDFVAYYHANVWGKVFDIDVVMLGCSTKQLLITTHYGAISLLEPSASIEQSQE